MKTVIDPFRLRPTSFLLVALLPLSVAAQEPTGNAVIRRKAGDSEIVITTTARMAGAIASLTWDGKEFLDSFDHGRELQSASNFDCGQPFIPEVFNPTEAGSNADGRGETSSSKLLQMRAAGSELEATTQMAFWLKPGEKSLGNPALNRKVLSDHLLSKRVRIGVEGFPHAIAYDVTFTVPEGERHTYAQFEAVTGYMPAEFSRFWTLHRKSGELKALDDGPGEQPAPVVFSTPSGAHAMGIYSPDPGPGYGRFRFDDAKVTKWNCVFRVRDANGVKPGEYSYRMFVVVGNLDEVKRTMKGLIDR